MSGGVGPSKKLKIYHFHTEWKEDFFPPKMLYSKCIYPIYQSTIAILKKGNAERNFQIVPKNYDTDSLLVSELRKTKVKQLKIQLSRQKSFFTQLTSKTKAATEASLWVSHFIIKNTKSF